MTTTTRTTVHHLTNGEFNWSFRITGEQATLTIFGGNTCCTPDIETMTLEEARKAYKDILRLIPRTRKGFTKRSRYRRITTEAQLAAYLGHETHDNWAEWALALEQEFHCQGYLQVAC